MSLVVIYTQFIQLFLGLNWRCEKPRGFVSWLVNHAQVRKDGHSEGDARKERIEGTQLQED